jgi:hypothetical protein
MSSKNKLPQRQSQLKAGSRSWSLSSSMANTETLFASTASYRKMRSDKLLSGQYDLSAHFLMQIKSKTTFLPNKSAKRILSKVQDFSAL